MADWNKKQISRSEIEELTKKYGIDSLFASVLSRRGIVEGKDLLYYLEDDLRFQHSPFNFKNMEDAVDRVLAAVEEKEKVLIFGDRDVDGVSATTILYDCLSSLGLDVSYRLPQGDETYGLSMDAVDDFASKDGSLIITVDCGISNYNEIEHAVDLGIDTIVMDHHNPPDLLSENAIYLDPKLPDSGYPFPDISGAAVVYKFVSAVRFSKSKWYKAECTLMNVRPVNEAYTIECIKIKNLIPLSKIEETIVPGTVSVMQTRLPSYLQNQVLLVWDGETTKHLLKNCFGSGIEFNFLDIRPEVAKLFPAFGQYSLLRIKDMSKIARYGSHPSTEIGGFYNIYVTYVQQSLKLENPDYSTLEEKDLQLVALAALADIMPMKNENRLFVRNGLKSINAGRIRGGLLELMSHLNLLGKKVSSVDLSWIIVSNLNAAGRLGQPELAAELFLSKDPSLRDQSALKIIELNSQRKLLSQEAWDYAAIQAEASIGQYSDKLCVVADSRINRGVSGILAGRLCAKYDIPAIAITFVDDICIGSMRSCRGYSVLSLLDQLNEFFLSYGGHNFAAGFSIKKENLDNFLNRLKQLAPLIELEESKANQYEVDAEIPNSYLTPKLLELEDKFEPYGEENKQLLFMSRGLSVKDGMLLGKGEKQHLKLTVEGANLKWPCLFWNEGERLNRDFRIGDKIDMLYHIERNTFNGMEKAQIIIQELEKSQIN